MMQQIRDGIKGPVIIGAILFIIGVPFAFSGIESYFQGSADPVVATVGDTKITQAQLGRSYEQRYRQLQQLLGENFRADQINAQRMRESVLQDMVQDALLRQQARKNGFRASDGALRDYLTAVPAFQENGQFSAERYRQLLTQVGQTPDGFEAQQRDALMIEQLRDSVLGSAVITADEAALAARLTKQEREFSYLQFDPKNYLAGVTVTPEQVSARYEEKKASYQAPERLKLAYVELALSALPKAEAPTPEVLKALYDAEKSSRFTTAETRRASHILINFGADKDAAKKKADELSTRLKAGEDFAALAKTASDDPGTRDKGGDLGVIKRGDGLLPAKFEAALFAMGKVGDISEPVDTDFGWTLIKLVELNAGRTQAFEEADVQKTLSELYFNKEQQANFQEKSKALEEQAFQSEASLEPAAKALEVPVQTTDWFTRAGGAGIAATPAVIEAAFSQDVLIDGLNSKPIAVDAERLVVVRKAEYEAPRQRELAEVEPAIRDELRNELAQAKAAADAQVALDALKAGQGIDAVAKTMNVTVQAPGPSTRDRSGVGAALMQSLFKLPRPAGTTPSLGQAKLEGGAIAVIALTAVREAELRPGAQAASEIASIREARAGAEFAAYREALKKRVAVEVKALPAEEPLSP